MTQLIACAFVGFLAGAAVGGFAMCIVIGAFLGWCDALRGSIDSSAD